jgi:carboxylesterase type B
MKRQFLVLHCAQTVLAFLAAISWGAPAFEQEQVKTANGTLEGIFNKTTGVHSFKGIPFAAPPVGDLRWKPPQPVKSWEDVRKAEKFGPRAMQLPLFSDMVFRSNGMSEDCLYLNVWTHAASGEERLPVLVYFFGGGFAGGDGSEGRYDGESMAQKGIVAVTVNYRLGMFGFFAHPELPLPLAEAEAKSVKIASNLGIGKEPALAALREMPAEQLLAAAAKAGGTWFAPTMDGYFFPKQPAAIFDAGEQAHVPLLAGTNSEESGFGGVLGKEKPAVENYRKALERLYPGKGDEVFELYPAENENQVMDVAQELACDRFISYGTWKWIDLATKTGGQPTYYYLYAHPRPAARPVAAPASGNEKDAPPKPAPKPSRGATHSAEIEYAMGNLDTNKVYAWTPDDYIVSKLMQEYFVNFIKTGNPNGPGLPEWPKFADGQRMILDVNSRAEKTEKLRARGEFFERNPGKKK